MLERENVVKGKGPQKLQRKRRFVFFFKENFVYGKNNLIRNNNLQKNQLKIFLSSHSIRSRQKNKVNENFDESNDERKLLMFLAAKKV